MYNVVEHERFFHFNTLDFLIHILSYIVIIKHHYYKLATNFPNCGYMCEMQKVPKFTNENLTLYLNVINVFDFFIVRNHTAYY